MKRHFAITMLFLGLLTGTPGCGGGGDTAGSGGAARIGLTLAVLALGALHRFLRSGILS